MFLEITICFLVLIICWLCLRPKSKVVCVPKRVEDFVAEVMADLGSVDPEDENLVSVQYLKSGKLKTRLVRTCVLLVRAKFALPRRTEANWRMVRQYIAEICVERNVRTTDVAKILDVATALCFIPTDMDIMARQVQFSREAITRDQEMSFVWESFYGVFGRVKDFVQA